MSFWIQGLNQLSSDQIVKLRKNKLDSVKLFYRGLQPRCLESELSRYSRPVSQNKALDLFDKDQYGTPHATEP